MLSPGTAAPDFQIENWRLQDALPSGPVLLVFFKISCPTCQFTMPFLQTFEGKGLRIVVISQDDAKGTSQFLNHFQITLPALHDKAWDFPVSSAFQISHVPSFFVIEQDGNVSASVEGFSKALLEQLGARFDVAPFAAATQPIPALKPG